jgi:hypothetical protein
MGADRESFSVYVDPWSKYVTHRDQPKRNLLGEIYLVVGDQPFPSDPWLDFPVKILSWWLEAYRHMRDTGEAASNTFMNGPYEFDTACSDGMVRIRFRERRRSGEVEPREPACVCEREYVQALLRAAEGIRDAIAEGAPSAESDAALLIAEIGRVRDLPEPESSRD